MITCPLPTLTPPPPKTDHRTQPTTASQPLTITIDFCFTREIGEIESEKQIVIHESTDLRETHWEGETPIEVIETHWSVKIDTDLIDTKFKMIDRLEEKRETKIRKKKKRERSRRKKKKKF